MKIKLALLVLISLITSVFAFAPAAEAGTMPNRSTNIEYIMVCNFNQRVVNITRRSAQG